MGIFDQLFSVAQQAGIFAFYLPFLIVFALLYGLLSRIQLFGGQNRMNNALNAIIAFSVALFVIGFTPAGITVSGFFGQFFSQATIALVTVIVGVIVLVLVGQTLGPAEFTKEGQRIPVGFMFGKYAALVLVLVVLGIFINSGGLVALGITDTGIFVPGVSGQDMVILIFIILTVLLVYWVSGFGSKG